MAMVTSFVLVNASPDRIADLAQELADLPSVAEVYSVSGEYELVAVVRVREHEELADVVTGSISKLPGIVRTRTLIAFRSYSKHDLDAMWSIGLD